MKIVILQKQDFIELVMGYKRSLLIISLLTHLMRRFKIKEYYFTMDEAAENFQLPRSMLKRAYNNDDILGFSRGGRLVFKAHDVLQLKCDIERAELSEQIKSIEQDISVLNDSAKIYRHKE
ncbi:MAG: hypothetical protein SNG27_05845 [Rikenellaceae bacterium]